MPNYLDLIGNKQIQLTENKDLGYKLYTFTPVPLNKISVNINDDLTKLLIETHKILGEIKGLTEYINDNGFFINLSKINESISSCKIDKINIDFLSYILKNKSIDDSSTEKANKYLKAMGAFNKDSFSSKYICGVHTLIMADDEIEYWVKHQHDFLGNIRNVQSFLFLGEGMQVTNELRYNPTPLENLYHLLEEMFDYYNKNTKYDILIKLALIHYQFESLHPFLGGNGRIGRLIIPKILTDNRLISYPVLAYSEYLALNKTEYFDRLWDSQLSRNLNKWVIYFLNGIIISANLVKKRFDKYIKLKNKEMALINSNENYRVKLLYLYEKITQNYFIDIKTAAETLDISFNTANKLIGILCDLDILRPINDQKRYKKYIYSMVEELLN